MSIQEQLRQQAIPKFKNHYVRYFDLEQISRESVDETQSLGEGATVKYIRAFAQIFSRTGRAGGGESGSAHMRQLPPASYFAKALEQELNRVRRYVEIFSEEMWVRLGGIVDLVAKVATPKAVGERLSSEQLDDLVRQCDEIGDDIVLLDEFLRQNVVACAHLTQRHDMMAWASRSGGGEPSEPLNLSSTYIQAMEQYLMTAVKHGTILVNLSDIYSQIRQLRSAGGGEGWSAPNSERAENRTLKFWVHPGDVLRLKCEVIKNLPIQVNKDRGNGNWKRLSFLKDAALEEWELMNSVYFDDEDFGTYYERLDRGQGAAVVRASWNGSRVLGNEETIFMEKKCQRDPWKGQTSIKETAGIQRGDIGSFLSGSAVPAVQGDSPQAKWLGDLQKRLLSRQESPLLRTEYRRTGFEEGDGNDIKMALDTHIRIIRERGSPKAKGDFFRDVRVKMEDGDVCHFPYAIFEMRLACETMPDWLKELLHSGMLVMIQKFSKFLHGTAVLYPDNLKKFPPWFVKNSDGKVVAATLEQISEMQEQKVNGSSYLYPSRPSLNRAPGQQTGSHVDHNHGNDMQVSTFCNVPGNSTVLSEVVVMPTRSADAVSRRETVSHLRLKIDGAGADKDSAKESSTNSDRKSEGKANKLLRWATSCKKPKSQDVDTPSASGSGPELPKAPALVRTRIEPKTFFANERTFLSWLSIAVLVMFMGLSLLDGGAIMGERSTATAQGGPGTNTTSTTTDSNVETASHLSGALITPVALLFIVYALVMYRKRSIQILRRETVRYDDQKGPIFLTFLLAGVLLLAYGFSLKAAFGKHEPSGSVVG
ncbi:hypothetical protein BSKO_07937 [Bryopsis sp. KO-2023]|nr:hypothetical protein BSKO_07937 [Bryopsis sp. KO-2023]